VAVLIYVALDLSSPELGAFGFDPADSVESIQTTNGRATARVVVVPSPAEHAFLTSQARPDLRPCQLPGELAAVARPVVSCLPRARCEPARPSEDPH
jgi:hypothetical protein